MKTAPWMAGVREAQAQRDREYAANTRYGVFVWRPDGRYTVVEAIRLYKRRGDAERKAGTDYVVRTIYLHQDP